MRADRMSDPHKKDDALAKRERGLSPALLAVLMFSGDRQGVPENKAPSRVPPTD